MTQTKVKICGLSSPESVTSAIEGKADFLGFVFYEPSPRHVEIDAAKYLVSFVPDNIERVGLIVDADNKSIEAITNNVALTMIQCHGNETACRIQEIKRLFNLPVIKAFSLNSEKDLAAVKEFENIADWFLFDAKKESLPGGNGKLFDWSILDGFTSDTPWLLAGGLTPENVGEAVQQLHPTAVDVSSGVKIVKRCKRHP